MIHLTERQYQRLQRGEPIGRATKYLNTKTTIDGILFDSAWEARTYTELKARLLAGEIRDLRLQVEFPLTVSGAVICRYRADFVFEERIPLKDPLPGLDPIVWEQRIVDTKSAPTRRTRDYRIKAKLMAALGTPITEVVSPRRRGRPR